MISTTCSMTCARVARRRGSDPARVLAGLVASLGCALVLAAPAAASDASSEARAVIEQTVTEVLAVLNNGDLTTEARLERLEKVAFARFDFDIVARLVLSRGWRRFSPAQREEFIHEFTNYLANSYGKRIDVYDQEQVEVTGARDEPRGDVTVHTRVVGGEYNGALIDYRMRKRDGEWRIIDVILEGISLVSNYRDQFREVLSRSGPDGLLEKLREKNAAAGVDDGGPQAAS